MAGYSDSYLRAFCLTNKLRYSLLHIRDVSANPSCKAWSKLIQSPFYFVVLTEHFVLVYKEQSSHARFLGLC